MSDLVGGVDGREFDHIVKRDTHRQHFAHGRLHIGHHTVHAVAVQIGADRVGQKALLDGAGAVAKPEAARAVAQIKDDTPLARLEHVGVDVAIRIQHRDVGGVDMGMDVARSRLLQDEFFITAFRWARMEVVHHRFAAQCRCLNRLIHRSPGNVQIVPG